jgi:hypothetical protein
MTDETTTPTLSDEDIRTIGQASTEERPGPDTDDADDSDSQDSDSDDVDSDSDDTDSSDADSQDQ